jgi:MFS family permease
MKIQRGSKRQRFYGWTALAGIMLVYCALCGNLIYSYGVFMPMMSESLQRSRAALSGPYSVFMIIGGMLGPIAGMTVSRFGARINIIVGNIVGVLGLLGMSQVEELWQSHLFFGIMGGVSLAFSEFVALTTVVNNWFIQKRSLAMGLLFASGGIGGFVFPPLISWLITSWGWREAWAAIAAIHLLLTVILGGILVRSRPEDIGQVPDGILGVPQVANSKLSNPRRVYQTTEDWTLRAALSTPALWMMVVIFSVTYFAAIMLTTHQIAYLEDMKFSPILAATVLGLMIGMSIIGRLACGALGLRYEGRHLGAVFLSIMGLGILSLIYARSISFIYLYSVLTGIGYGGMLVLMPNLFGAYFGRKHYSRIVGWIAPMMTLASALSPVIAGILYGSTGNYFFSFSLAAGLLFLSALIAFFIWPPQPAMAMEHKPAIEEPEGTVRQSRNGQASTAEDAEIAEMKICLT